MSDVRRFPSLRSSLAGVLVAGVAFVGSTVPASAGTIATTMTATPSPVAVGGTLAVHGVGCTGTGASLTVQLFEGSVPGFTTPLGSPVDTDTVTPASGTWDATLMVPASATPGDNVTVYGVCTTDTSNFAYENVVVPLVAAPTTTTTSTTTTLAAPTSTGATSTTVATAPATAVPASPTYTG